MFTANSMNCLPRRIGLALPGNGTILATHTARKELFEDAGRQVVEITRRYYEQDDETVLPRAIATRDAFENAMALDMAMGGSTNTILHLLAAAHEAGVDFGLKEIDELSRRVPCLCKVAPSHGERTTSRTCTARAASRPSSASCDRGGLLHQDVHTVHSGTLGELPRRLGHPRRRRSPPEAVELWHAAPGQRPHRQAVTRRPPAGRRSTSTGPRAASATSSTPTARDGGLAVLYGNLAPDGGVVKTAGVDE